MGNVRNNLIAQMERNVEKLREREAELYRELERLEADVSEYNDLLRELDPGVKIEAPEPQVEPRAGKKRKILELADDWMSAAQITEELNVSGQYTRELVKALREEGRLEFRKGARVGRYGKAPLLYRRKQVGPQITNVTVDREYLVVGVNSE